MLIWLRTQNDLPDMQDNHQHVYGTPFIEKTVSMLWKRWLKDVRHATILSIKRHQQPLQTILHLFPAIPINCAISWVTLPRNLMKEMKKFAWRSVFIIDWYQVRQFLLLLGTCLAYSWRNRFAFIHFNPYLRRILWPKYWTMGKMVWKAAWNPCFAHRIHFRDKILIALSTELDHTQSGCRTSILPML